MKIDEMEGRDPIKCDFCDLNDDGQCNMFGMPVERAVKYLCHMDEDDYDIQWDVCCSYVDGKVIPKCGHFTTTEVEGKNGMFGTCEKIKMTFFLRWFLGRKVCDWHTKPKARQVSMEDLR